MASKFHFDDIDSFYLNQRRKIRWVGDIILEYNYKIGDINFILCSDRKILEINNEFLKHDYYTDIITFDYCANNVINGDIYISIDRVKENADDLELFFLEEFNRVLIHGILHLIGFKDGSEKEKIRMRKLEDKCLRIYYDSE